MIRPFYKVKRIWLAVGSGGVRGSIFNSTNAGMRSMAARCLYYVSGAGEEEGR